MTLLIFLFDVITTRAFPKKNNTEKKMRSKKNEESGVYENSPSPKNQIPQQQNKFVKNIHKKIVFE